MTDSEKNFWFTFYIGQLGIPCERHTLHGLNVIFRIIKIQSNILILKFIYQLTNTLLSTLLLSWLVGPVITPKILYPTDKQVLFSAYNV